MPVYMNQFSYTLDAWKALARNPVDRREALRAMMEPLGVRLIELYYGDVGEYDGFVLFEAPDDIVANAGVVAARCAGSFKAMKMTKLQTVEEMMQSLGKARHLTYQPVSPTR